MTRVLILGDLHGSVHENIYRQIEITEPDFVLQCGDYSCYDVTWPVPLYFITGNHEVTRDYYRAPIDQIKSGEYILPANNNMLIAGLHDIMGIKIVALPTKPMPGAAPGPALYEKEDYDKCLAVTEKVDIFISHGCGFPFWVFVAGRRINVEDTGLTHLIRKLRPKWAISGHNHAYERIEEDGIQLVRLGTNGPQIHDMLLFSE